MIGIDTSPAMLAQARASAAEAGVELELHEGDMRDLALDEPAALIYCPFRALLHLPTWADRRRTFERVAASLRPGGRFAWNAFAFDHHIAARLDGEHQTEPVPHTLRYAVGDNRIDIMLDDGGTSSLWWATKNEWLGLIDVAGLEVEALYGGFAREPFADDSSRVRLRLPPLGGGGRVCRPPPLVSALAPQTAAHWPDAVPATVFGAPKLVTPGSLPVHTRSRAMALPTSPTP